MFGLGPGELLLLALVIALVGGVPAVKKVFRLLGKAQQARSKLSSRAIVDHLMADDRPSKRRPVPAGKRSSKDGASAAPGRRPEPDRSPEESAP